MRLDIDNDRHIILDNRSYCTLHNKIHLINENPVKTLRQAFGLVQFILLYFRFHISLTCEII